MTTKRKCAIIPAIGEIMNEMLQITDAELHEVMKAPLAIVEFWATWCPGCKAANPTIKRISGELKGQVLVVGANIEQAPKATEKYEITQIPTLVFFKDGREFHRMDGTSPYRTLMPEIKQRFGI